MAYGFGSGCCKIAASQNVGCGSLFWSLHAQETTDVGAVLCVFSRKQGVSLELLGILSLTDFLYVFKSVSPHHSQTMACPVLIWSSSNDLPAPQKHFGSGCLMHMGVTRQLQQSHICSVIPLAISCRHSVLCGACCCPSSQSWCAALALLGQWHALSILQRAKTYPNATSHGRWRDERGSTVSLRTRGARDTNNAVSSGCHWGVLSPSFLVRSACTLLGWSGEVSWWTKFNNLSLILSVWTSILELGIIQICETQS